MKIKRLFTLLALLVLFFRLCSSVFAADTPEEGIHHRLSLSFELEQSTLYATSHISLPRDTPLHLRFGPLVVTGVVLEQANSTPVQLRVDGDNSITLARSTDTRQLYVSWELRTRETPDRDNLIAATGITLAGFWHPIGDRDMRFSVDAVLPAHFSAITEAETLQTTTDKHAPRIHATFPHLVQNIHFVAGPYVIFRKQLDTLTLYAYFFEEDKHLAPAYLEKAAGYIDRYQHLIGPFPYSRYSIVENRLPTGYGIPTFTLLGQAVVRLPFIVNTSLGHEVLHSWFGNSVFVRSGTGNWTEGLTTYLADQSYAQESGEGPQYRKQQLIRYEAFSGSGQPLSLRNFHNSSHAHTASRAIRSVGYDKASMLFHMLQQLIGRDNFIQALSRFYREHQFQRVGWQELQAAFEQVAGHKLDSFFRQWLDRLDAPRLSFGRVEVRLQDGQAIIEGELVQENDQPYTLQVPLRIHTLEGPIDHTVTSNRHRQPFQLSTPSLPSSITIDPDYDLMRRLLEKERIPTLAHLMGSSKQQLLLPGKGAAAFAPLARLVEQWGGTVVTDETVSNQDLQQGSWVFAGDSAARRSLFGSYRQPGAGFSLDVHFNPFDQEHVVVLVDSASVEETQAACTKLRHYGKYSSLQFDAGVNTLRKVAAADNGIITLLLPTPSAVPVETALDFAGTIKRLQDARVVYIGEIHTDYGAHLLQLQIIQGLYQSNPDLIIAMEMFPRSSQQALDDYIQGTIESEGKFLQASRYFSVWGYDYRLYRDIIAFAKQRNLPLIGLNLDKEITSTLFRQGSTNPLTAEQLATIARERDLTLPGYRQRLLEAFSMHAAPHSGNAFAGFLQAQALWDETMAESVVSTLHRFPDRQMIVIAGNGHVHKQSGIPPRVHRRLPGISQQVVVPVHDGGRASALRAGADLLMETPSLQLPASGKIGVVLEETASGNVRILRISPHGHAGEAGLLPEDLITRVNSVQVSSITDVRAALLDSIAGERAVVEVVRDERTLQFSVELSSAKQGAVPKGHPEVSPASSSGRHSLP